ncbi:MAG TPA: VanZ family protein [Leptolyngbyaceae cyanobacterium]
MYFKIAVLGLLGIFLYKLFPYSFFPITSFSIQDIIHQFSQDRLAQFKDYIELLISLLTFAPLGFGLAGLLKNQHLKGIATLLITLLISASWSTTTEALQALVTSRNPNLLDILTDTLGGAAGWLCFYHGRFQLLKYTSAVQRWGREFLRSHLSLPTLATGFISYFLVATVAMMTLPTATDLSNWDSSFPLLLGNELTGDRPWNGRVEAVHFFDRAISPADIKQLFSGSREPLVGSDTLLASYELTDQHNNYPDQTGQLPELSWKGDSSETKQEAGVLLSAAHWLQTPAPATYLNERIKQSAQLTLDVVVRPDSLKQRGPARILSLSKNARQRNLTLGQEGSNLVLRLRTPVTGQNGSNPEMIVPQVFTDSNPRHLVMTYVNSTLRVYVDGLEHLYTFKIPSVGYKALYYGGFFIPLASLLSLLFVVIQGRLTMRIALLIGGTVLPVLLLEGLLTSTDHRSFSLENLFMSLFFMVGTLLVVGGQIKPWLKAA